MGGGKAAVLVRVAGRRCLEREGHEDVGAGVGAGWEGVGWDVAEADGLVEMDGGGEFGAAAEEEGGCADEAGLGDGVVEQLPAETLAAMMRRDCHLGELVDAVADGNEGDAASGFGAGEEQEDMAALAKDGGLGIVEGLAVAGLEGEVAGDPLFVQGAEGGGVVAGAEGADGDGLGLGVGLGLGDEMGVGGRFAGESS